MRRKAALWQCMLTCVALAVAALVPVGSLKAQTSPPRDSLIVAAAINTFHSAMARGDSTLVISLLQPDASIVHGGIVRSVREFRASLLRDEIQRARAMPGITLPARITVRGDIAWAVTTTRREGMIAGKKMREVVAELVILSRSFQGWRINAIQWSSSQVPSVP